MNAIPPQTIIDYQTPQKLQSNAINYHPYPSTSIRVPYFSGASGSLSTAYFPLATLTIGTPGILRTLRLRSLSFYIHTSASYSKHFCNPTYCSNDIYPTLHHPIHNTVICICTLMIALQSFPLQQQRISILSGGEGEIEGWLLFRRVLFGGRYGSVGLWDRDVSCA